MGRYVVTLNHYKDKRFINLDYQDTNIEKALYRTHRYSVAEIKSILKRAEELKALIDADDNE